MPSDIALVARYLEPPSRSFWKWDDNGEVICWNNGETIVFREELHEILRRVSPSGLPGFNIVLLTLAAMRPGVEASLEQIRGAVVSTKTGRESSAPPESVPLDSRSFLTLQLLVPRLRGSVEDKANLCRVVFEELPCALNPQQANTVVTYLRSSTSELLSSSRERTGAKPQSLSVVELQRFQARLNAMAPDTVEQRIEISLDVIPQPAEVDLPPALRMRALIETLQEDESLKGLAKLARQVMAAISLPHRISDPNASSIGGVSGISNRGPLDRLLLTELVHDDLTLAVRISSNEAMFVHRESPPQATRREFAVLLDSGIRMWGVPRVYATAVAMALIANADKRTTVTTFRAAGNIVEEVDLSTRAGLLDHLEKLRLEPHPGSGLVALASRLQSAEDCQPVLITTPAAVEDHDFQRSAAVSGLVFWYTAMVDAEGTLRLEQRSPTGRKRLREVQLDLDQIYSDPHRPLPALVDRTWADNLPAIMRTDPFPLLLSVSLGQDQMMYLGDQGLVGISKDRRLIHWHRAKSFGGKQVTDHLPPGRFHSYLYRSTLERLCVLLSKSGDGEPHLLTFHLATGRVSVVSLDGPLGTLVDLHEGVALIRTPVSLRAVDTETGEDLANRSLSAERLGKATGRFFQSQHDNQWFAATYTGGAIQLEKVFWNAPPDSPLVHMMECDGVEGPVAVTNEGDIFFTANGETLKTQMPVGRFERDRPIWSDGSRIVLPTAANGSEACVIDVRQRTSSVSRCRRSNPILDQAFRDLRQSNLRHRFHAIMIAQGEDEERWLVLETRKGKFFIDGNFQMVFRPLTKPERILSHTCRSFQPLTIPEVGFQLHRAVWDDGSDAFLDSRGLLHLRSSDSEIPEATLVLTDGWLAGWVADGRLWGRPYFTGSEGSEVDERQVYHDTIAAFLQRIMEWE